MARMGQSTAAMAIRYQHVMEGRDAAIAASLDRLIRSSDGAEPNGTHVARNRRKPKTRSAERSTEQRG
jgi:hypothetical protein